MHIEIHIGDYWGRKYDYLFHYVPFRLKYNLKFSNWNECMEAIKNPEMYMPSGFVPSENDVIWDIGSQFGDFTLLWSRKKANVYAFELDKKNYDKMKTNIIINHGFQKGGIKIYNTAVGDGNYINYLIAGDMANKSTSENGNYVKSIRMDDFPVPDPDIIKIDVEGFEMEVLDGSKMTIRKCRPKIIIETHTSKLKEDVMKFMKEENYILYLEGRKVIDKGNEIQNLFFVSHNKEV